MNPDTIHLFWIFFWLILINLVIFVLWSLMALSGSISREEEQREAEHNAKRN
jgi:hypothetical protein